MSEAFLPSTGQTVNIDVASTTANVQVTTGTGISQVRIFNNGTATTWIRHGLDNTVTAAVTNMPIGPGESKIMSFQNPAWIAAIAAASTGKIYFTPGNGGI